MNNCEIGVMYLWTHAVVTLNKITYQGVEYTLEELKALGL